MKPVAPSRHILSNRIQLKSVMKSFLRLRAGHLGLLGFALAMTSDWEVRAQILQNIGTLPAGESVIITVDVKIQSPLPANVTAVSAQATVTYNGSQTALSDDPKTPALGDATITFLNQDFVFGKAPDPPYPSFLANNGARHFIPEGGATIYLGTHPPVPSLDAQPVPIPSPDGVTFPASLGAGLTLTLPVIVKGNGNLNAWIDWSANGQWTDAGDQIATNLSLTEAGNPNLIFIAIPPWVKTGASFARFRYSTDRDLLPTGLAVDGEVEDYLVQLAANLPPVAGSVALQADENRVTTFPTANILASSSDPNGDLLTVFSVGPVSDHGGFAQLAGSGVVYTPPLNYLGIDSFSFTVSDGRGGTAVGLVSVQISDPNSIWNNPITIINSGSGGYQIQFTGLPERRYQLEFSAKVTGPWAALGNPITADSRGGIVVADTTQPEATRYYRIVAAP